MSQAETTKEYIIQQAAELFNQKGYAGCSIADIMQATGLKKGGIYNHFKSKDEIAIQAFDYAVRVVRQQVWQAVKQETSAVARLKAMLQVYLSYVDNPPIAGGCPILNTAIESDDTHPLLRDRTRRAMSDWRGLIVRIVQKGIKKQELQPDVAPEVVASFLIASVEGGVMMSKLYQDAVHLQRTIASLDDYLERLSATS